MTPPTGTVARRSLRLEITGVVQGVGFRPFVVRLARELGLVGHVGNDATMVFVELEGDEDRLAEFRARLATDAPPMARIQHVEELAGRSVGAARFDIVESTSSVGVRSLVPPDVATCDACRSELRDPDNRRHRHPFITCTDCGPRFTIIRSLPYDRPDTTMHAHEMCDRCRREYEDPDDRRFHAQPISCPDCGPRLRSEIDAEVHHDDDALVAAAAALRAGRILAVKGIGGYHLACDAANDDAVRTLRRRKGRPDQPFAVMIASLDEVDGVAAVSPEERSALVSAQRPIVLLRARTPTPLAPSVAPGHPLVGVMLPYSPLHHLLLDEVGGPLVMTSGNRSGEPICHRDDDVRERLGPLVDGVLDHDREIAVPCDDSVVRVVGGQERAVRRSRGFAPLPVRLPDDGPPVLAVGGELKTTFCVTSGRHAWMSQHIGDMGDLATLEAFEAAVTHLLSLHGVEPTVVAADDHPGYLTTSWARRHHRERLVTVQHHHAHVAAVLAEHGRPADERVLGVAFDGTGYGTDATVWGGELLVATATSAERVGHLATVALPGGDAAVEHPARMALSHLWAAGLGWDDDLAPVRALSLAERRLLRIQLERGVGCVATSSAGRLFDAVAALVGLRQRVTYEGQAAIELEGLALPARDAPRVHPFDVVDGAVVRLDPAPVLRGIVGDLRAGATPDVLAAGFHVALAEAIAGAVRIQRDRTGIGTVALSGGCFANALLDGLVQERLTALDLEVLTHREVPPNDAGLALGQAWVAAQRVRATRSHAGPASPAQED